VGIGLQQSIAAQMEKTTQRLIHPGDVVRRLHTAKRNSYKADPISTPDNPDEDEERLARLHVLGLGVCEIDGDEVCHCRARRDVIALSDCSSRGTAAEVNRLPYWSCDRAHAGT
jgi:hypothetical protein